ncbi:MAG: sulfatase-like hydrolase/transferase [Saprospiraceae bacterium]|nr:sulfatase-like hydrolase/transferase [Saprospiraceae bacterium]
MKYLFTILCLCLLTCKTPQNEVVERPNILFLFADDQTFDALNALGNKQINTPHLDQLVREGFTFTHAFNQGSWSGAVCVVSRAMLASGRYIYHAREDLMRVPLWGQVMGEVGYQTFLTGKWHNEAPSALKSFQTAKSVGAGMYETYGGVGGPGYHRPVAGSDDRWSPSDTSLLGHWSPKFYDIVSDGTNKKKTDEYTVHQHTSEVYADHAIDFIEQQTIQKESRPFFMYVAFNAPHDPRQSPKEYVDQYPLEDIKLPDAYLPEHPFDQGEKLTLRDEILAPIPRTEYAIKKHLQEYYAIITHLDAQIGRILKALKESGKYENTYIIFTADHGLAVGKHGLLGKQNQYDHSVRVPMVIVGPDIPAQQKSDALVYLQSMYPTTCDLVGISIPGTVEFKSLLPLLKNQDGGEEAIFGSYKDYQRMVRTKTHKLILYPEVGQSQFFDLQNDPDELQNSIAEPGNQEIVRSLYNQLLTLQQEVGDTLVLPPLNLDTSE